MTDRSSTRIAPDHTRAVRVLAVVGPTGVGKSAIAEELAVRLGGEIISADSMQVYRGMDIGTAKTPPDERRVPYHCIDLIDPGSAYSAALYQRDARRAIDRVSRGGALPVLVGGTGMYVRAALDPWQFPAGEQVANPVRERLESMAQDVGSAGLHLHLREKDPQAAELIHPNNVRRVIRALEMLEEGVSYADQHATFGVRESIYPTRIFGLSMDRQALYQRIDERVDRMLAEGLLEEVASLLHAGLREAVTAQHAIGYKELVPVLEGHRDLSDAVEEIKRSTRRYAKRQLTWFRGDGRVEWIDVTELSVEAASDRIAAALDYRQPTDHHLGDAG